MLYIAIKKIRQKLMICLFEAKASNLSLLTINGPINCPIERNKMSVITGLIIKLLTTSFGKLLYIDGNRDVGGVPTMINVGIRINANFCLEVNDLFQKTLVDCIFVSHVIFFEHEK